MTATTHYAFSYLLCSAAGADPNIALTASLFSLLPDIDHPESTIGRIFYPLSKTIQRKYGHRTITHSVFAIMAISVVLIPFLIIPQLLKWGNDFWSALYAASLLAYSSHIFIDLFNKSGVRLFSPLSQKEYISFKTYELRIKVSSWQEYLLLFIITFMAFSVSGRGFSIHTAVRSIGKKIFKTYDNAVKDYQENSAYLCIAQIDYFDTIERRKIIATLPILNMYPQTGFFLKNNTRIIIGKEYITEITVEKTEKKINTKRISGSDPTILKNINHESYISGTINIKNYFPEIKSNDFINVKRNSEGVTFILKCAAPWELSRLLNLNNEINNELEKLKKNLCSYKIQQLQNEEIRIKNKIDVLRKNGLYKNYANITKLSAIIKKIQSKITTLEMQENLGADLETQEKINLLSNSFSFWFDLVVFEL